MRGVLKQAAEVSGVQMAGMSGVKAGEKPARADPGDSHLALIGRKRREVRP